MQLLHDDVEHPHRMRLRELLDHRFHVIQDELLPGLGESTLVSIAIDCWTSPNTLSFLAITCYYITDDWEYKEELIGFEPVKGTHPGENLAYKVQDVLTRLNLKHRLLAITADNASNNDTLRQSLESWPGKQHISWSAEAMKVNCLAHVFNLSAQVLLVGLHIADDDVDDEDFDVFGSGQSTTEEEEATGCLAEAVDKVRKKFLCCHK